MTRDDAQPTSSEPTDPATPSPVTSTVSPPSAARGVRGADGIEIRKVTEAEYPDWMRAIAVGFLSAPAVTEAEIEGRRGGIDVDPTRGARAARPVGGPGPPVPPPPEGARRPPPRAPAHPK
ncbi:hypothetical protein ACFW15_08805, partial [Streptomyces sp. NPDC058953]